MTMVIMLLAARVFADGLPLEFTHSERILSLAKGTLEVFNELNVGSGLNFNLKNWHNCKLEREIYYLPQKMHMK